MRVQERLAEASSGGPARISQIRNAWLLSSYGHPLTALYTPVSEANKV